MSDNPSQCPVQMIKHSAIGDVTPGFGLPLRSITNVTFELLRCHAALLRSLMLTTCSHSFLASCANTMRDVPLAPRWHGTAASRHFRSTKVSLRGTRASSFMEDSKTAPSEETNRGAQ